MRKITLLTILLASVTGCSSAGEPSAVAAFCNNRIFCEAFLADIISGFLTSFVFLFSLLFFFRPRIKLGDKIVTHVKAYGNGADPRRWYVFKMVNRSFFRAFDLRVEVVKRVPVAGPDGRTNHRSDALRLVKSDYNYVAPFRYGEKSDYALWFLTSDDIDGLLSENESYKVEIRVICKHALTGLGSVVVKSYSKHDIKQGTFKSGNTFDIVE